MADGWDPASKASNVGGISNTRHNLTMSYLGSTTGNMDLARNNYGEVCVYCHTPHGANSTIDGPLWNRTNKGTTYTTYDMALMSGQTPAQPGINSLTCLSCHDGAVAIDSIINMPGSGRYDGSQQTGQNNTFLSQWDNASGTNPTTHGTLSDCTSCHGPNPFGVPDFTVFVIGTDLRNDHPVGVSLPNTAIHDFKAPNAQKGGLKFYDNGNGRADSNEVRFYDTGAGFKVECASCHDPHGVSPSGHGGALNPSFLRVANTQSTLCLTCHDK